MTGDKRIVLIQRFLELSQGVLFFIDFRDFSDPGFGILSPSPTLPIRRYAERLPCAAGNIWLVVPLA